MVEGGGGVTGENLLSIKRRHYEGEGTEMTFALVLFRMRN